MLYESCGCSPRPLGVVLASRGCSQPVHGLSPLTAIRRPIWQVRYASVLGPQNFPGHATGTERRALSSSTSQITLKDAGRWYFRENCQIRAADRKQHRGRHFECHSVAELLSEHCFCGKCSTSHVLDASGRKGCSGNPAAARSCSGHPPDHRPA